MVCEPPLVIHDRELFGTGSMSFHHLHHGAYLVGQSCPPVRHILPDGTHGPFGIRSYWCGKPPRVKAPTWPLPLGPPCAAPSLDDPPVNGFCRCFALLHSTPQISAYDHHSSGCCVFLEKIEKWVLSWAYMVLSWHHRLSLAHCGSRR
jgi:hypothetical protein